MHLTSLIIKIVVLSASHPLLCKGRLLSRRRIESFFIFGRYSFSKTSSFF